MGARRCITTADIAVAKLITLVEWAKRRYDRPLSSRTLRRWAQSGNIIPQTKKEGRAYYVPENARYIDTTSPDYLEEVAAALHESSPQ